MSEAELRAWDHRPIEEFLLALHRATRASSGSSVSCFGLYFILPLLGGLRRRGDLVVPAHGARQLPVVPDRRRRSRSRAPICAAAERLRRARRGRAPGPRAHRAERGAGAGRHRGRRARSRPRGGLDDRRCATSSSLVGADDFPRGLARSRARRSAAATWRCRRRSRSPPPRAGRRASSAAARATLASIRWHSRSTTHRDLRRPRAGRVPERGAGLLPDPDELRPGARADGHAAPHRLRGRAHAPTSTSEDDERTWIDALLGAMDALVPGCRDDAIFVDTIGVRALASWIGKRGGPAVSTGQTPDQVGGAPPARAHAAPPASTSPATPPAAAASAPSSRRTARWSASTPSLADAAAGVI